MAKKLDIPALVAKHNGRVQVGNPVCEEVRYDWRTVWDDQDEADAFSDEVLALGHQIKANNDWVKGVYTVWFTVS